MYFSKLQFIIYSECHSYYSFCEPALIARRRIPYFLDKVLGRIFQISAQKWAFIGRRALNRGERLLRFPRRNVPGKFTAFTKSEAMGKTFKKEVTQRTYPRGILFDNMALDVGVYLGKSAYFRKYASS